MRLLSYSAIRSKIKVGDQIGCQGSDWLQKIIRFFKGGVWDLSHVSSIIRDAHNEGTGRVEVLEALTKGGTKRNYLSKAYKKAHGKLFWIPMNCNDEQRTQLMKLGAEILEQKIKYDFKSTWLAIFSPIFVDVAKFNCSELSWYMLTTVGRLLKRFDKDFKEIAPAPGDLPTWAGIEPIEIDMTK